MKKSLIMVLLIEVGLCFSIAGCGSGGNGVSTSTQSPNTMEGSWNIELMTLNESGSPEIMDFTKVNLINGSGVAVFSGALSGVTLDLQGMNFNTTNCGNLLANSNVESFTFTNCFTNPFKILNIFSQFSLTTPQQIYPAARISLTPDHGWY